MKLARRWMATLGLVAAVAVPTHGHTLRVLVTRPVPQPGMKNTVYLSYGHLLPVDEVIAADEVGPYQIHTPSGSIQPLQLAGKSLQANDVSFTEPGLYQVAVTRKPITYVSYTDAAGKTGSARVPKTEAKLPEGAKLTFSARSYNFSKAVVLNEVTSGTETPALGHPLEILVESKPGPKGYSADGKTQVRVVFRGKPLAGVKVGAASTTRNPDGLPEVSAETDSDGRASLDLVEPGTWVLDVLHVVEADPADRARFDNERFVATTSIPVTDK